jgi:hypothetical protein
MPYYNRRGSRDYVVLKQTQGAHTELVRTGQEAEVMLY